MVKFYGFLSCAKDSFIKIDDMILLVYFCVVYREQKKHRIKFLSRSATFYLKIYTFRMNGGRMYKFSITLTLFCKTAHNFKLKFIFN